MRRSRPSRGPGRTIAQPPRGTVPDFIDSALTSPRGTLTESAAVRRMAEDMRDGAYREGGVSEAELLGKGFTAAQIKMHGPAARALAQQLAGPSL